MAQQTGGFASHPLFMIVGLGAGVAAVIALAIVATSPTTGIAVGPGPMVETIYPADEEATPAVLEEPVEEPVEEAAEETAPAQEEVPVEGAVVEEAPVEETPDGVIVDDTPALDVDTPEQTDSDIGFEPGAEAPALDTAVEQQSGQNVTPEQTNQLTTPTGESADVVTNPSAATGTEPGTTARDAATDTITPAPADATPGTEPVTEPTVDPDGEGAPVVPTPSGPEGADGNPLTEG